MRHLSVISVLSLLVVLATGCNDQGFPTAVFQEDAAQPRFLLSPSLQSATQIRPGPLVQVGCAVPGMPADLDRVVDIAVARDASFAVREDGTVAAWAFPEEDAFGRYEGEDPRTEVPPDLNDAVAIDANTFHVVALRSNGTLVSWGDYSPPAITGLTDVVKFDVGNNHGIALKSDGTVAVWPADGYQPPASLTDVVDVAVTYAGWTYVALKSDGTVVVWGEPWFYGPNAWDWYVPHPPAGLDDVVAIDAGVTHIMALKSDGTVVAWEGYVTYGNVNVPAGLNNVVAITAGARSSFAVKADGTVVSWGNVFSCLGSSWDPVEFPWEDGPSRWPQGLTNVAKIASGNAAQGLAILRNSPPVANAGDDRTLECEENCASGTILDGRESFDLDGDDLTYLWSSATCDIADANASVTQASCPLGTNTVTLVVNDGRDDSEPDGVTITVEDTTPPEIENVTPNPSVLWAPNGEMTLVELDIEAADACDIVPPVCQITSVSSNEPAGKNGPDFEIVSLTSLLLRAERLGTGDGRVYTIALECTDRAGNTGVGSVQVQVSHDQR